VRVNASVLGSAEPHVHARLIPGRPNELNFSQALWDPGPVGHHPGAGWCGLTVHAGRLGFPAATTEPGVTEGTVTS
jgi:hypothetical protein